MCQSRLSASPSKLSPSRCRVLHTNLAANLNALAYSIIVGRGGRMRVASVASQRASTKMFPRKRSTAVDHAPTCWKRSQNPCHPLFLSNGAAGYCSRHTYRWVGADKWEEGVWLPAAGCESACSWLSISNGEHTSPYSSPQHAEATFQRNAPASRDTWIMGVVVVYDCLASVALQ